jgi:prepilin-type processing-associated H-X9-DG protein
LIEALVVITVIIVLAGLLLPALARAKVRAATPVCLHNLKQLQLAWLEYAADHQDRMPPNRGDPYAGRTEPVWVAGYMGYSGAGDPLGSDATNTALLVEEGPGRLGPYVRAAGVYKCPADRYLARCGGRRVSRVRTCALNGCANGAKDEPVNGFFARLESLRQPPPAEFLGFVDVHEDSLGVAEFAPVPQDAGGCSVDLPASRHGRAGTLTFADGHGMVKRWKDPRTLRPVYGEQAMVWSTGSTLNNEDIRWLYRHATRPDPRFA